MRIDNTDERPAPLRAQPPSGSGGRQTQPGGFFNPYALGGYYILPRRGVSDPATIATKQGLQRLALGSPLRLLSYLPDVDPAIGLAVWNALRLTCGQGAVKIVAVKESKPGAGDEQVDDEATASLDALWDNLPSQIGGFDGLLSTLVLTALMTGMPCLEAVPGPSGKGVFRVWPIDPLTIFFHWNVETTEVEPLQWQIVPKVPTYIGNYVSLNTNTFFWRAFDAPVDDPYGRAPYGPAIAQVLADLALIQDLRDSLHNSAWPRLGYGFNFTEMFKVATEVMQIGDPEKAAAWVKARFDEAVEAAAQIKPDENVFYDGMAKLAVIEGGKGLSAVESILTFLRQRVVQAVKSLPTLMGINDGSTQTYTTVEWQIYAAGLEALRDIAISLLIKTANLHLRLLGKPHTAAANVQRIRTTDDVMEAQAEQQRIANEVKKIQLGWITNEQACIAVTGNGPAGEPMPGALDVAPAPSTTPSDPPEDPEAPPKQDKNGQPEEDKAA